jgi:uncharacterized protein
MRRAEKEIKVKEEIEDILKRAHICHLGLCDNGIPYVVPVNYGYADGCLYIHSAREGRKIDILRFNDKVSFTIYVGEKLVDTGKVCNWGMKYKCVMGTGRASLLTSLPEIENALGIILHHYSGKEMPFEPAMLNKLLIINIQIENITGKKSG